MLKDEPNRKNDLTETLEPIKAKSSTDSDDPSLDNPYTLMDEPILKNDRNDKPLPVQQ
jgi:hypothetical protein